MRATRNITFLLILIVSLSCLGLSCKEEVVVEEELGFDTEYTDDDSLYYFETEIKESGTQQVDEVTYYLDSEGEIDYEYGEIDRVTIQEPVNEIVAEGTKRPEGKLWYFVGRFGINERGDRRWMDNYQDISRYSYVYDFETEVNQPVSVSMAKQLVAELKKTSTLYQSDSDTAMVAYQTLTRAFPTMNFNWKSSSPDSNLKIVRKRGLAYSYNLSLNEDVLYPNESEFPVPVTWMADGQLVYPSEFTLVTGIFEHMNIGRVDGDQIHNNVRYGSLSGWSALSPDLRQVAVPFNNRVIVLDINRGSRTIGMPDLNGWPRTFDTANSMISFDPNSELICYTWSKETFTDRSSDIEHFFIANPWTNSNIRLEGIEREVATEAPFFWLE
jgi:hypothetical protein